MIIDDKTKKITPIFGDEWMPVDDIPPEELEKSADRLEAELVQRDKDMKRWNANGENNLKILINLQLEASKGGKGTNYIGERVRFIRELNEQSMGDLQLAAEVSKSTLHRCENGRSIPSERNLRKIIAALFISVAEFSYAPNDFEQWKNSITGVSTYNDIYSFKKETLDKLAKGNFTYKSPSGKIVRVPFKYVALLRNLINDSFAVIELMPHKKS